MLLTPTELERLTIYTAAELARKRRAKGLKLNHPEAIAIIVDEILEGAREGRSVADLIGYGSTILSSDDVMAGVAELMPVIQIEGTFPDGTKLVTVHEPIRPGQQAVPKGAIAPGEIIAADGDIEINAGRRKSTVKAVNTGDRPIQVGSHFHFFETNRALAFNRAAAYGLRLNIAAGTAVRFEPGEEKDVELTEFAGDRRIHGFNGLVEGILSGEGRFEQALERLRDGGFATE